MMRLLYRCLLALHPPAFRRRFAEEMTWVFDKAVAEQGAGSLYWDALVSLSRQWFLRSAAWKVLAAITGAFATVYAGPLLLLTNPPSRQLAGYPLNTPQGFVIIAGLTSVLIVSLTLILAIAWFRFSRRRCA